ncbi:MAG: M16 family metallopeptidase, partial [Nitrospinota bacterium]
MKKLLALATLAFTLSAYGAWASELRWDVKEHFLPNGLKVLLLEDHRAPVLTFQVWYRVGSRDEAPGQTGLSHMLEHMMFKGTPQHGPGVFSNLVQKQGGRHNAFTSQDYTAYFENIASDRAEVALELEADRMVNLILDPEEIARERKVVMEERRSSVEDRPERELFEKVAATAFRVHPYGWPIVGRASDIKNFNREKLLSHYRKYYKPNNATAILVGDFNPAEMLKLLERYFGPIPAGPAPPKLKAVEPPQRKERRVTLRRVARLPSVVMAFHVPNIL